MQYWDAMFTIIGLGFVGRDVLLRAAGTVTVQFHDLGYNVYEVSLLYLECHVKYRVSFQYYLSSYLADDAWLVTA